MQKYFWIIALPAFPAAYLANTIWAPGHLIAVIPGLYVVVGAYDLWFSPHTLNRLYPVAAYFRYALEFIRPRYASSL